MIKRLFKVILFMPCVIIDGLFVIMFMPLYYIVTGKNAMDIFTPILNKLENW